MFFDSWMDLLHTAVAGVFAYIGLIILLRISGKRTLSKWNAFDFIVTIAFGSILGSIILLRDVSIAQGVFGFALLVILQFCISWLSVHTPVVKAWVKGTPTLLVYRGKIQHQTLRHERITEGEICAAVRQHGYAALEDIEAVVLETNGNFSVIKQLQHPSASAMVDVNGYSRETMAV
ncbi:MAG: YetF domain-containing protein [Synechococcales bacterium]|nr:YetF domain-containing protein [Synechococcales bacterium]